MCSAKLNTYSSTGSEKERLCMKPVLYLVVPCYNEATVLPVTAPMFLNKLDGLILTEKIHKDSRILFINGGSTDGTMDVIRSLCEQEEQFVGLSLSRNQGQQGAMLAGLSEAMGRCDITITVDCDGQDDLNAIGEMVDAYLDGSEIVYGVRSDRKSDTFLKRNTALAFYRVMHWLGVETVYNHSEYRLMSARAVRELLRFKEVNLFLRGLVPLVGFKSSCVYYERHERQAGETHYSYGKLMSLAFEGITSFSIKPIRMISAVGAVFALCGLLGYGWALWSFFSGNTVPGWPSLYCLIIGVGGVQLLSLGVIGEYIGKIYLETKARPRFIIDERLYE